MQSASDLLTADETAPPDVRIVMPTVDPGPWFEEVISSLSAQNYSSFSTTIVHGEDDGVMIESQVADLDDVTLESLPADAGFGEKVNAIAEASTERLLLIMHDDVALGDGAVSGLVHEWVRRRDERSVVGAKLLDWNDSERLMPAGFVADRFGQTRFSAQPGDLDQGQQDSGSDHFGTSTACLLISREFFLSLGGFDEGVKWHGEAHDLALRVRSLGGYVTTAAGAAARHRGAFEGRESAPSDANLRGRQMRSVLSATKTSSLPLVILSFAVLHLIEMAVAISRFNFRDVARIPRAWFWNLSRLGSLRSRRSMLVNSTDFNSDDVQLVRQRGSLRLSESVDRRIAEREIASEDGGGGSGTLSIVRGMGGIVIGGLVAFGARRLFTTDLPRVGEFRTIPDEFGTLTTDWWSGLRTWGMGSDGFASAGLPLLDVAGALLLGSASALEFATLIAPIPIGVIGAWRLFARSRSDWAPVACALLYAASPLPYNAISGGSASALWLYAALPWIFANLVGVAQPVGATGVMLARRRDPGAATISLMFILAVLTAFNPFAIGSLIILVTGLLLGSLLSGDMRGAFPVMSVSLLAIFGAGVLNAPELLSLGSWEQFARAGATAPTDLALTDILTLSNGPVGSSVLGWAVFAPALAPLLLGVGQKFTWAMRVWGAMLLSFGIAWLVIRGWMPVGMPTLEVILAPVALGMAVLGGLTAVTAELDLRGARFRVLFASALAVIGVTVAGIPLLDVASDGRWELARVDLSTTLTSLDTAPEDGTYRVVWIGDAHVLGGASIPTENDVSWASSLDGVPDVRALWGGLDTEATAALGDVIDAGLAGQTSRLGQQLAPFGVQFIVVVDQQAPVPEISRSVVVSDNETAALNGQLDLVRDGVVNPAVTIYRNTAWAPVNSAIAPATMQSGTIENAVPAVVNRVDHETFEGQTRDGRDVFVSWQPSAQWTFTVDGQVAPRIDAGEFAMGFETANTPSTAAQLTYTTLLRDRVVVIMQALAWIIAFMVRRVFLSSERRIVRGEVLTEQGSERLV